MKKKFGTFLSLLTIASAAIPSCIISSCRASDDGIYVKPNAVSNAEFNSETNTLKIINDYYNPLQTEKYYWSWLMLDAVDKSDDHWYSTIKKCTLDLSTVPDDLKNKIFVTLENGGCLIWFEQSANILEWDEFTITVNYDCGISKGSYTFKVAAQCQDRTYKLDHTLFIGEFNSTKTEIAWTGTKQNCGSIDGHPNAPIMNGWFLWNFKNIEFTSDPRGRYIYDNCFNFIEWKHPDAPVSRGGVFGDIGPYTYIDLWYDISLPMNDLLWNWVWGTAQDTNSGNIKNLIIDDYDNNPNWKQNGYKTLQIGNPYTWRSWNKMFYKCYSLLPSLHHYFDGFTNEVPIVKDGSSTGEPGTPTETYQFTPEDVDAMVYGY